MACQLRAGTHIFEPKAGEHRWWEGDGSLLPVWPSVKPHPHLLLIPSVLNLAQCQLLIDCFERNREQNAARSDNDYWDGRFIWSNGLPRTEVGALRLMQQLRFFSTLKLIERYQPKRPLFSDTAQLVRWHPGLELVPHADNIHPEGTPNATAHRDYSSILYLNDDYQGGETYFPGHRLKVKPEPGTLVLFGAGCDYVHGVTPIKSGMRYTYAGWFTHDPAWEDREAKVIF